ncbi:MAG: ROK family protein [Halanaerobium sp.]
MSKQRVGNSTFIHNLNQGSIFKIIHRRGPITRKQLAESTSYSAATITNHVKKLIEEEYVIETEKGTSNGGRKPVYIKVNSKKGYMLALNIGVNHSQLYLFNLAFEVLASKNIDIEHQEDAEFNLLQIKDQIEQLLDEQQIKREKILGLGVGVPALIDREKNSLEFAPNLGWRDLEIPKFYAQYFDFPVLLENEAKAAVIGEKEFVYPDIENLVFVSINEGIGCGILLDGKLYTGASGNAGEFGHLIIDSDGPKCHCGNDGCWETLASESYFQDKVNSYLDSDLSIDQMYQLDFEKDEKLKSIIKSGVCNIGIGLVNIINSLSPEHIVIGGGIIRAEGYLMENINQIIDQKSLRISREFVDLKFTELEGLATIYGLAAQVFNLSVEIVS